MANRTTQFKINNNRKSAFWQTLALALLCLTLLFLPLGNTASAWFYFSTPNTVTLKTAPDVPFTLNVYALNNDGTVSSCAVSNDAIAVPISFTFFCWDDQYFCDDDNTLYYVFEVIYDSDAFFTDASRLPLEAIISADMTYAALDGSNAYTVGGSYWRFPFCTVSYAIGRADLDLSQKHVALYAAQQASYDELIGTTAITNASSTGTTATGTLTASHTDDMRSVASTYYKQTVLKNGEAAERLRLIYYVKVQASESLVTTRINSLGSGAPALTLQTTLTMNSTFHTIPAYTGS